MTTLSPHAYARQYAHQSISPSRCSTAKGLLVFTDGESGAASIERTNDLVWPGNSTAGGQQVRQFETESDAVAFMHEQQAWFERCSHARFRTGASRVDFAGSVSLDSAPDILLTTAHDAGAPWSLEFDGWVREGKVANAAYLLGDRGTTAADLQRVGSAVISAARAKLRASA